MSAENENKRQYTVVKAAAEMGVSKATARVLLESFVQNGLAKKFTQPGARQSLVSERLYNLLVQLSKD